MPGAIDRADPGLSADEIGWLATLPDVESRLVIAGTDDTAAYRVEQGPFDEQRLVNLPQHNWTLLVQDVEKHLPELRVLYRWVDFVPDWRIDDLMVSVAAPGGSVGPHRDKYDVFLCQARGRREWRLADKDAAIEASRQDGLSLLEPFVDDSPVLAAPGDVLYLPPDIPHWGIALELCVTWSVGLRAPQRSDFERMHARLFGGAGRESEDDAFYTDPDLSADEATPGRISPDAVRRLCKLYPPAASLDELEAASLLGAVVTEPKPHLVPHPLPREEARRVLARPPDQGLGVHGMARIAWYRSADFALMFANGHIRRTSLLQLDLIQQMCSERRIAAGVLEALTSDKDNFELVHWLLCAGALDEGPGDSG